MSDDSQVLRVQGLLERLKAGDSKALDELLSLTYDRLNRLASSMLRAYPKVRRWDQTGDVLAGACMRLQRALADVKPDTARDFFRLAALQVRRELRDLARRYNGPHGLNTNYESHDPVAGATPAEAASDSTYDPVRLADWSAFHEQAGALAEEARDVFDLIYYEGLSQDEVAALLGVSVKTVKRRWRDARLALYDTLGGRLPGV
jgi:RNA polymerase sigma factor (sigma-70 family)